MPRTPSARRSVRSTGQSIYEVMLIIACAAMALAVFFAVHEYVSFYHGPTKPYKFESAAAARRRAAADPAAGARRLRDAAATAAPTPAPTTTPAPGGEPPAPAAPATTAGAGGDDALELSRAGVARDSLDAGCGLPATAR